MRILALDLSKSCTGFAIWHPGWEMARLGNWRLGGEYSSNGDVFAKLQSNLHDLLNTIGFDKIFWEQKINPQNLAGITSAQTVSLMGGLEAHVESFGSVFRIPGRAISVSSWRADFVGRDEIGEIRKAVRVESKARGKKISATDSLKAATMARARQLGFTPRKQDEADALGILDYQMGLEKIIAPWRLNETLRASMQVRK